MGEFVDQRRKFLGGAQARAQRDDIIEHPAMDSVGQSCAHEPRAAALEVGFETLNVLEDRCHRTTSSGA